MAKVFAEQYPRNEQGWLLFPKDVDRRRGLFSPDVMKHPAKFNIYMIEALVEYLTEPGDIVLDPFAGSGTVMLAGLMGRKALLIEVEPHYIQTLTESILLNGADAEVLTGDCRQVLPVTCDCVITSPPYSNISRTSPLPDLKGQILPYINHPLNLGRLNDFYFLQAMETVYKKLAESLPQGNPVIIVTRDAMEKDSRKLLSGGIIRQATRNGFGLSEWLKWRPPGSKQGAIQKSRGFKTVEDEDILIFRRK